MRYRIEFDEYCPAKDFMAVDCGENGKHCPVEIAVCVVKAHRKAEKGTRCPGLGQPGCPAVKVDFCEWKIRNDHVVADTGCGVRHPISFTSTPEYCPYCGMLTEVVK